MLGGTASALAKQVAVVIKVLSPGVGVQSYVVCCHVFKPREINSVFISDSDSSSLPFYSHFFPKYKQVKG